MSSPATVSGSSTPSRSGLLRQKGNRLLQSIKDLQPGPRTRALHEVEELYKRSVPCSVLFLGAQLRHFVSFGLAAGPWMQQLTRQSRQRATKILRPATFRLHTLRMRCTTEMKRHVPVTLHFQLGIAAEHLLPAEHSLSGLVLQP